MLIINLESRDIMKKTYNKLVRDKIPEIIKNNGEIPKIRILNDEEYKEELELKLYEEYKEVIESNSTDRLEELADLLEVINALANLENKDLSDIIEIANNKSLSTLQNDIITYAKEMTRNVNNDDKYFENKNKYEESLKLYNSNPLVINLHEISKSVESILLELKKILE